MISWRVAMLQCLPPGAFPLCLGLGLGLSSGSAAGLVLGDESDSSRACPSARAMMIVVRGSNNK